MKILFTSHAMTLMKKAREKVVSTRIWLLRIWESENWKLLMEKAHV
jgi:hypothetical protein